MLRTAWMRLGVFTGIFVAGMGAARGQDLTFFREHSIPLSPRSTPCCQGTVAGDSSGGLYVLMGDTLRKYNSAGTEVWSKQIGIASPLGVVLTLAANAAGVFVAGGTATDVALPGQTTAGGGDAFVRRYDPNGVEIWTRQFGTPSAETANMLAADATGVYVAGSVWLPSTPGPGTHYLTRFDLSGGRLWSNEFDMGGGQLIGASADSAGVYVSSAFGPAPTLLRVNARGNIIWTRQLEQSGVPLIAADELGVYVGQQSAIRRLDQMGTELWSRPMNAGLSFAQPVASPSDSTGVYLLGMVDRALPGQCFAGAFDLVLSKMSSSGDQLWTRQFGTAWGDNPIGAGIDGTSVYVYGYHQVGTDADGTPPPSGAFLAKFEKSSAPIVDARPRIQSECILNAASYLGGGVAPGEIVTILGSAMGPAELTRLQVTPDGRIPTTLAGVRILFDGQPAPLIYVSDKQSSAIVPHDVAGKSAVEIQVEYKGVLSAAVRMPVFRSRLGVFTVSSSSDVRQGAIVNQNGTINSPSNPAERGSVVSLYATGAGLPEPAGANDQITGDRPSTFRVLPRFRLVSDGSDEDFNSYPTEVQYHGGTPRSVPGLVQTNVRIPLDVPPGGTVPLFVLSVSGLVEQIVTIAIR